MKLKIVFHTDNAAFFDASGGTVEITRILRAIAADFELGKNGHLADNIPASIRDADGNCIGEWKWGK